MVPLCLNIGYPKPGTRPLSIGLSPAEVYSVFAKATVCLLGAEVSPYYIRVHTFDDLFHFVSFRSISFRSVPGFITSRMREVLFAGLDSGLDWTLDSGLDSGLLAGVKWSGPLLRNQEPGASL